jgi:branched-chain amino acid transport system substrate-binding protein
MTPRPPLRLGLAIGCLTLLATGCGTRVSESGAATASPDNSSPITSPVATAADPGAAAAAPLGSTPAGSNGATGNSARTDGSASPAGGGGSTSATPATTKTDEGTGGASTATAPRSPGSKPSAGSGPSTGPGDRATPLPPGSGSSNPVPAPGTAAARSPIVIGSIGTYSGPLGSVLTEMVNAVQVWTRFINDRGGLNGHAVKLLIADDGGDPARHRAQVQDLVERQKVIAFVANGEAISGQGSISYLQEKRVPVIGSEGANDYFYENSMYFPQMPTGSALLKAFLASAAQQLVPAKKKLATLVCREATACTVADRIWGADGYAKSHGFEVVYRGQASVAQPDFTAECLNAQRSGAEVVLILMDTNSVLRVANSCHRQAFNPTFAWGGNATSRTQPGTPGLDGGSIGATVFPWMVGDTPATAEFQGAMAQYQKGVAPTGSHTVGWVAAKLFERAAAAMPEPPSAAAVLEGLWKISNDDLGGLTYPLAFQRDKPAQPRVCWFNVRIAGGAFTAPAGARYTCE